MRLKRHLLASNPKFLDNWEEEYLCGGGGTWLAFYGNYLCLKYGRFKPHFTKTFRKRYYYIEVSHFTLIQYILKHSWSHLMFFNLFVLIHCNQYLWANQLNSAEFLLHLCNTYCSAPLTPNDALYPEYKVLSCCFVFSCTSQKENILCLWLPSLGRTGKVILLPVPLCCTHLFSNSFRKMLWCQPSY